MNTEKDFEKLKHREESYQKSLENKPSISLVTKYSHLKTFQNILTILIILLVIILLYTITVFTETKSWDQWISWCYLIGVVWSIYVHKMLHKIIDFLFDLNNN